MVKWWEFGIFFVTLQTMIEFDLPEEKAYSARINRQTLLTIKKGVRNYIIIGKRYRNMNYTAKQLAEDIGVNTRYLSAAIRLHFGCNFAELVNKLRVEDAKVMMLDRECTLTMEDISYSVGFANRQSFYTAFAKFVGVKPKEWLAQQREEEQQRIEEERRIAQKNIKFEGLAFE